jgi:hypothetical protein
VRATSRVLSPTALRTDTGDVRALALAVMVLAACSDSSQPADAGTEAVAACGPSTCSGCCLDRTCVTKVHVGACGAGGLPCVVCGPTDLCQQGRCKSSADQGTPPSCGPSTCPSGCCDGAQCQTSQSNDRCGTGGEACKTCTGNQTCVAGACKAGCSDECTPSGKRECVDAVTARECGNFDPDDCLEWKTLAACGAGKVCRYGLCEAPGTCTINVVCKCCTIANSCSGADVHCDATVSGAEVAPGKSTAAGYTWFAGGQSTSVSYCTTTGAFNRYIGSSGTDTFHFSYCNPKSAGDCGCTTLSDCSKSFSWDKTALCN